MLFFFKEKPIEITAVVSSAYSQVCELSPIKLASECRPSWWKNTPSSKFDWNLFGPTSTVKSCPGVGLSIQRGFILPMWSDLALETQGELWKWVYSDRKSRVEVHSNFQAPGFYEDHHIFKVNSPWKIISSVDLFVCSPFYLNNKAPLYSTPSGFIPPILNTCAVNPFLMFKKDIQKQQYLIKCGSPLLHILPFTDKKINFKCEIVSNEEYEKISNRTATNNHFIGRGLKNKLFDK